MPYVTNRGVRIHYDVEGAGPPLVLQHGYTLNSELWYRFGSVDALKLHFRLVLVDARGHGASDKPHDRAAYVWPISVTDILAVVDDLGIERAAFWGYSMGGAIVLGLAQQISIASNLRSGCICFKTSTIIKNELSMDWSYPQK